MLPETCKGSAEVAGGEGHGVQDGGGCGHRGEEEQGAQDAVRRPARGSCQDALDGDQEGEGDR